MEMKFQVVLRCDRTVLAVFASISDAEWFAHHNCYVPEQLEIVRA